MQADNLAEYNTEKYADYTKRADSQNLLKKMREELKSQQKVDQNIAVVSGGTQEQINAAAKRRGDYMANVMSNIAASGQQYKDAAKARYLQNKATLNNAQLGILEQKSQSGSNAMYNGLNTLSSLDWSKMGLGSGSAGVSLTS